ncbi:MAG: SRPBCC family protein [Solirubrobacterales bacterium]
MGEPDGVSGEIEIEASPDEVWAVVMDPRRLGEWVSLHKNVEDPPEAPMTEGDEFTQRMTLMGTDFAVEWKVLEADRPTWARWKGNGPMGSEATCTYELSETDPGTRFVYENSFEMPGFGSMADKLTGGKAAEEAQKSLERLKKTVEKD